MEYDSSDEESGEDDQLMGFGLSEKYARHRSLSAKFTVTLLFT